LTSTGRRGLEEGAKEAVVVVVVEEEEEKQQQKWARSIARRGRERERMESRSEVKVGDGRRCS
jgi:hypothetical protein